MAIAMTTFSSSTFSSSRKPPRTTITRDTSHAIYNTIYSITFTNFNDKRTFDHDKNKSDCVEYLEKHHHIDEFFNIPINQLVNTHYENVFGKENSFATEHLHQTIGKGVWKRERIVTHNETFSFIVDSIEREVMLLYKKPYKI
jgi:hypothetical protein